MSTPIGGGVVGGGVYGVGTIRDGGDHERREGVGVDQGIKEGLGIRDVAINSSKGNH